MNNESKSLPPRRHLTAEAMTPRPGNASMKTSLAALVTRNRKVNSKATKSRQIASILSLLDTDEGIHSPTVNGGRSVTAIVAQALDEVDKGYSRRIVRRRPDWKNMHKATRDQ